MSALRVAVPKGRLLAGVLDAFAAAGFDVPRDEIMTSRRLVIERGEIEWVVVKDADAPLYVELGAVALGVAGRDQLLEQQSDVYQPLELPFGRCRMMLIAGAGAPPLGDAGTIATKYPNVTRAFIERSRLRARVVTLAGSVELAPRLGVAPYIVDLVETGATLRANDLRPVETLELVAPSLIVNKNAWRLQRKRITSVIEALEQGISIEVTS